MYVMLMDCLNRMADMLDDLLFNWLIDSVTVPARTRILYVSDSVSDVLHFSSQDLVGQSLFDILHPKVSRYAISVKAA